MMMVVVVVIATASLKLIGGNDTAFGRTAELVFKLNGGVANVEALAEKMIDAFQNDGAL